MSVKKLLENILIYTSNVRIKLILLLWGLYKLQINFMIFLNCSKMRAFYVTFNLLGFNLILISSDMSFKLINSLVFND